VSRPAAARRPAPARRLTLALMALACAPLAARAQDAPVDSLIAAGRAATARGDHAEAYRLFRAAYDPSADDARVLAMLAGASSSLGDLPRFHAFLDSMVGSGPGPRHALEYWAALSLDMGAPPESVLEAIDRHLAARQDDEGTLIALVRLLAAHRSAGIAGEVIDSAILRGADRARLAIPLGDARRDAGDPAAAIDAYLAAADSTQAAERIRDLLAAHPPGYSRDPLIERLRQARSAGDEEIARRAAALLADVEGAATAGMGAAVPDAGAAASGASAAAADAAYAREPLLSARDTTALADALARARGRLADAQLVALRAGDMWLARGAPDSAVASYARAVEPARAGELGSAALEALARIRLVRALGRAPAPALSALGALLVEAPAEPGAAVGRLDSLIGSLGLADSSAARPLAAALAAEWRGQAGDPAGASAALEAAAATAGDESPALLLAAGRWAAAASEDERARELWRAVVERYGESPYALEARRLLARPAGEGR